MSSSQEALERLHPGLQRWVGRQGWPSLRPIQEDAVEPILEAKVDVILAAATASGKTEAAFFPIMTSLANRPAQGSLGAVCVSPLKALINDQFDRLEDLGKAVNLKISRWHGDVTASKKKRVLTDPSGILLITPESLEALFVRKGSQVRGLFGDLRYLVIDELHAFIGTERGRQVQSLLNRVELLLRRRLPRIALSATLGDLSLASDFLRPSDGKDVLLLKDPDSRQNVKIQIRGYKMTTPLVAPQQPDQRKSSPIDDPDPKSSGGTFDIAQDLFQCLRGGHHLVFANRRSDVEEFADRLRRLCEVTGVPNEFWPHHGSLSKDLREAAERAINDKSRPTTLVATSTLELGINIGSIESVAQIGAPPSVSALKQRLGRSGRQGTASVLRIAIQEPEVTPKTSYQEALHPRLLQAIAMVELLLKGWVEPPSGSSLHLSTLTQQTLSLLAQTGGVRAEDLFSALCIAGPFSAVSKELFLQFLRSIGQSDLITQDHSGELLLGLQGERLVDHYSFYSAFSSPEEYRLMSQGQTLGQLPIGIPLFPGLLIIFGGRRWRVLDVEESQKIINLEVAVGGKTPQFVGTGGPLVHSVVREEMLAIYRGKRIPTYLDRVARELLEEARSWFSRLGLHNYCILAEGNSVLVFPWAGDRAVSTLLLLIAKAGLQVTHNGFVLEIDGAKPEQVLDHLRAIATKPLPTAQDLARRASNRKTQKFHPYLEDDLLIEDYSAAALDPEGAGRVLRRLVNG